VVELCREVTEGLNARGEPVNHGSTAEAPLASPRESRPLVIVGLGVLLIAALGILVVRLWPEQSLAGRSEPVTVLVASGRPCNISLPPEDRTRHGLNWFTYGTWPDSPDGSPGATHAGTMTYTAKDEATVQVDGLVIRFKGYQPDDFPEAACPLDGTFWVTPQ
jgi:hypothetical protein